LPSGKLLLKQALLFKKNIKRAIFSIKLEYHL
jgi:hypothetical protein